MEFSQLELDELTILVNHGIAYFEEKKKQNPVSNFYYQERIEKLKLIRKKLTQLNDRGE